MAADLIHVQREVGPMANFCYLIGDPATKKAAVVDPSFDARPVQRFAAENGLAVEMRSPAAKGPRRTRAVSISPRRAPRLP